MAWTIVHPYLIQVVKRLKNGKENAAKDPFTFPFALQVGVGGLEPPTSASQTRRASRLRYTPADKSIIRTMEKRQETFPFQLSMRDPFGCIAIMVLILSACQPIQAPPQTATLTVKPEATATLKPTHTTSLEIETDLLQPTPVTQTPTPDCLTVGGTIQMGSFSSKILEDDFNYQIYLPPCYRTTTTQRYPVVYLLHGLLDTNDQWLRLGLAEKMNTLVTDGNIPPFIIVLPQEAKMAPPQTSPFPEALVEELVPWIDSRYRTFAERGSRAIGGLSRGAAWAVQIGFEYPHVFAAVGAHSLPLFQADGNKVRGWLTQLPPEDLPRVFVDIGRSDQDVQSAEEFAEQLDFYHIPHEWYLYVGGHTESYWSSHLEQYLRWYASNW